MQRNLLTSRIASHVYTCLGWIFFIHLDISKLKLWIESIHFEVWGQGVTED